MQILQVLQILRRKFPITCIPGRGTRLPTAPLKSLPFCHFRRARSVRSVAVSVPHISGPPAKRSGAPTRHSGPLAKTGGDTTGTGTEGRSLISNCAVGAAGLGLRKLALYLHSLSQLCHCSRQDSTVLQRLHLAQLRFRWKDPSVTNTL